MPNSIIGSTNVAATLWIPGGNNIMCGTRISVTSAVVAGSVQLTMSWHDPTAGTQNYVQTVLLTTLGNSLFASFPIVSDTAAGITYKVDLVGVTLGTPGYDIVIAYAPIY